MYSLTAIIFIYVTCTLIVQININKHKITLYLIIKLNIQICKFNNSTKLILTFMRDLKFCKNYICAF